MADVMEFVMRFGVEFSVQEFEAMSRKIFAKDNSSLSYK